MVYLTVIAGLELAVILCLGLALLMGNKWFVEATAHNEEAAKQERARFLAAVQRPDVVQPVQRTGDAAAQARARDQERIRNLASVGTVQHARPE